MSVGENTRFLWGWYRARRADDRWPTLILPGDGGRRRSWMWLAVFGLHAHHDFRARVSREKLQLRAKRMNDPVTSAWKASDPEDSSSWILSKER